MIVEREKNPCSILYVVGGLGTGGLERQLFYLLQAMDQERYYPIVFVWNYLESDMYVSWIHALGVPIKFFPKRLSSFGKLMAFRRLVKNLKPQVVHSYSFYTNFSAWWATLGSTTVSLGSFRQDFLTERRVTGRVLGRLSGRLPSSQIANSYAAKQNAERFSWFFRPPQIYTVRNGLDIRQFSVYPVPRTRPILLSAGRLSPEKRWDRLLKSVAQLVEGGLVFSVQLAGEGPLRKQLESQVTDLGLENVVQLLGLQKDMSVLLKGSAFLVHTADAEGCPNIVMEAMASGRAVVSTDAGDVSHLVDDGKTGFVIRRGQDQELIERMMILIQNPSLCCRMGSAARLKAEREFGLDRLVSETLAAYRSTGWRDY